MIIATTRKITVAITELIDSLPMPHIPCPDVQPPLSRVPKPTKSPPIMTNGYESVILKEWSGRVNAIANGSLA